MPTCNFSYNQVSQKRNHKHSFYNNINKSLFILTSLKLKCRFYELAVCFAMAINLPIINYEKSLSKDVHLPLMCGL